MGALAVPLVALVIVTALEVYQSADEARDVRDQTDLAEASIGPASLLSLIEDERNAAGVYMLNAQDAFALPVEDNAQARAATDKEVAAFREQVESLGGEVEAAYGPALDAMDGIDELRNQIDSFEGTRDLKNIGPTAEIFDAYGPFMAPFFEANKQVALSIDNPELRRGAELVDLSSRQTDLIAQLTRDLLLAAIGGDTKLNQPEEVSAVAGRLGQLETNKDLIQTKATGDYALLSGSLFHSEEVQEFPDVVEAALDTGSVDVDGVIRYSAGEDPETYGYTVFRESVTDELASKADQLESDAVARQRAYLVLAALALGVAILVTWLVSRSITRPLRSLTRQATAMADHRLPEAVLDILDTPLGEDVEVPEVDPVAVHTRDEVSDVADALNTVQDTALDLAVEQAVLRRNIADSFVNLGRRNQNLLGRQLDFITELETNETNPDTLSNLFRLDHLATRMRRNAESLLVLAGVEPPRKWAAPVRLTDVIRAALGEVEDYQRVTVRGVEPATIVGAAAADLAHLLAELIENALVFSPPDQTVDIRGRSRPARAAVGAEGMSRAAVGAEGMSRAAVGAEGMSRAAVGAEGMSRDVGGADQVSGYTLAVIDSGLGMPPADIEAANRRLAGAESFTIAPSKYLGHYVAGNLAARHGIGVRLDASPGNGITATVNIPPALLTTEPVVGVPAAPPDDGRELPAPGTPAAPEPVGVAAVAGGLVTSATEAAAEEAGDPWRNGEYRPAVTSSWPAPVGLSAGTAPPDPGQSRTQSGLVKRARANGTGPVEPERGPGTAEAAPVAPGADPSGDLLAALRRHSSNLQGVPGMAGQPPYPPPSARGPQSVPPPAGAPPLSPTHRPASGVYDPTARHDRIPGGEGRQRPPAQGEPPTRRPDVGAGQPPPRPPSGVPGPTGPTGPVPAGGTDAGPPLTRRVRGAQMPTTNPMSLRRTTGEHPVAPGGPAAQPRDRAQPPRQSRSADDVYSFLSSFTAGVQRGLDDSRPPDRSGEDNGSG
jgi:signal transduction histidine kinase